MFKKRYFQINHNFKTGLLSELFLIIGLILLAFFIFFVIISTAFNDGSTGFAKQLYDISVSTVPESLLSLSLISLAIGVIMYFFSCQFAKLEKIAEEIENNDEFKEEQ